MSEKRDDQERPCLHCMMIELIDGFFAEYPATPGEPDTIDTDEVVTAIAKTMAERSVYPAHDMHPKRPQPKIRRGDDAGVGRLRHVVQETGRDIQRRAHTRTLRLTSGLPKLSWAIY